MNMDDELKKIIESFVKSSKDQSRKKTFEDVSEDIKKRCANCEDKCIIGERFTSDGIKFESPVSESKQPPKECQIALKKLGLNQFTDDDVIKCLSEEDDIYIINCSKLNEMMPPMAGKKLAEDIHYLYLQSKISSNYDEMVKSLNFIGGVVCDLSELTNVLETTHKLTKDNYSKLLLAVSALEDTFKDLTGEEK